MRILVAVIAIFLSSLSIILFTHNRSKKATTTSNSSPRIIIVNELDRAYPLPISGCGAGGSCSLDRENGDNCLRAKQYDEAISYYREALKINPGDTRALVGLGHACMATGDSDSAINPLSRLRNLCQQDRAEKEASSDEIEYAPKFSTITDFFFLPKQARDALDYEARMALEKAVLQSSKGWLKKQHLNKKFETDHHYLVLNSSLELARKFHRQSKGEELKAMYQLAEENTRGIPLEVITECTAQGDTDQLWSKLSRLALNSAIAEEKDWYLNRLIAIQEKMPKDDIRRAAISHMVGVSLANDDYHANGSCQIQDAAEIMMNKRADYPKFYANCLYDRALDMYDEKKSKQTLLNALSAYSASDEASAEDKGDTYYNLGIVSYKMGQMSAAKELFLKATHEYRKCKKPKLQDQEQALNNRAILSIEYGIEPGDDLFFKDYENNCSSLASCALQGIYHLKKNELEKSKSLFDKAYKFSQQTRIEGEVENDKPLRVVDKSYTNQEVLTKFFERKGRMPDFIFSRFAKSAPVSYMLARERPLTTEIPQWEPAVQSLYLTVANHAAPKGETIPVDPSMNSNSPLARQAATEQVEKDYLATVKNIIEHCWFSSDHATIEQAIIRVKITRDGTIQLVAMDQVNIDPRLYSTIIDEALPWASPLPNPPESLRDKEIIVIFNAHEYDSSMCYAIPARGFAPRPEAW